jgi:hypothetical protein
VTPRYHAAVAVAVPAPLPVIGPPTPHGRRRSSTVSILVVIGLSAVLTAGQRIPPIRAKPV